MVKKARKSSKTRASKAGAKAAGAVKASPAKVRTRSAKTLPANPINSEPARPGLVDDPVYYFVVKTVCTGPKPAGRRKAPRVSAKIAQPTWHLMDEGAHQDNRRYQFQVVQTGTGMNAGAKIEIGDLTQSFTSVAQVVAWTKGAGASWLSNADCWEICSVVMARG